MPDQQQAPPDLTRAVLREIGPRLRAARLKRSLTLEALAEITGISASTLSRMEAGRRAPNLELLIPVTRGLRISLDDLLLWKAPDPRVQAPTRRFANLTVDYLSPETAPVQTFKMTFTPSPGPIQTRSHDGYEWIYVLRGRARVILGDRDLVVEIGEAAEFDTRIPHGVAALGNEPLEVLSIFNRSGERIHLPGISDRYELPD
ncbi:XRE family transcriptional regulator [Leifsonia sp. LS1]|uniref:helix-turn-helix domain-containing protein n=1 Tax=Leifsonia sp. LS1 TaxID=2828483 RepID=UPI001CFF0137|nr:helix-turn-helix transcriptional regulator [Leifsonia sp. LS1]GIT81458.1 XRE family transcriptional regulator [Leifsonia sp. LS1]